MTPQTHTLLAAITNLALPAGSQDASTPAKAASILALYIAVLWRTAITLGGLAVIIYMLVGGFYWITASGDKGKIEEAKERIMQAIIGFAVLCSVAAVSVFIGPAFGLDLLKPNFAVLSGGGGSGGGGGGGGPPGSCANVDPEINGYTADGAHACYTINPPNCYKCNSGSWQDVPETEAGCPSQCQVEH